MPDYGATTKHGLRVLEGTSLVNDIDAGFTALGQDLDDIIATDDQGVIASRPVSTPGSPGKTGRWYKTTDGGRLYRDHGTGYDEIPLGDLNGQLGDLNGLRKLIAQARSYVPAGAAAGTYFAREGGAVGADAATAVPGAGLPAMVQLLAPRYDVSGKDTELFLDLDVAANGVAPGPALHWRGLLCPAVMAGTGGNVGVDFGAAAVDTGSQLLSNLAGALGTDSNSSSAAFPSSGNYVFCVENMDAAVPANCVIVCTWRLYVVHV